MANTKSAQKELRKSTKKKIHNLKAKDNIKNLAKKCKKAIKSKDEKAKELFAQTIKALDKAAQKGIIKKNTRDRKKSRLHKKLNAELKSK